MYVHRYVCNCDVFKWLTHVLAAGVMYARHLALHTLTHNPAVRVNIHDKIAAADLRTRTLSFYCSGQLWPVDVY